MSREINKRVSGSCKRREHGDIEVGIFSPKYKHKDATNHRVNSDCHNDPVLNL